MIKALITVRSSSTRLPRKCFLDFGGKMMIEHIINRVKFFKIDPIICTTEQDSDKELVNIAKKNDVKYFCGSEKNKLKRWNDCCNNFNIDRFHSIDADDPYFCAEEVIRSMSFLDKGYDIIYPSPSSLLGGATVGYSIKNDALSKICNTIEPTTDTEMISSFILDHNEIKIYRMTDPDNDVITSRMTLDYEEDYQKLCKILRQLGHFATRSQLHRFLVDNPSIESMNTFRNEEWAARQSNQSKKPI
tara:strand:- start:2122 stop:2859 length:738 start_codon:yes stop_codon:yes gene_type:complete